MSPALTDQSVPNMGKRDFMIPPTDISFVYPDIQDMPLPIFLCIKHVDEPVPPTSRHWAIVWDVRHIRGKPTRAFRMLHITRERDKRGVPCEHLTNWGPMTKTVDSTEVTRSRFISLGQIGLSKRKRLEDIASEMPVRAADGKWSCQQWILSVLRVAVQEGILAVNVEEIRTAALAV